MCIGRSFCPHTDHSSRAMHWPVRAMQTPFPRTCASGCRQHTSESTATRCSADTATHMSPSHSLRGIHACWGNTLRSRAVGGHRGFCFAGGLSNTMFVLPGDAGTL